MLTIEDPAFGTQVVNFNDFISLTREEVKFLNSLPTLTLLSCR